jgi:S-formylglutathione hydrolase FrmB
MALIHCNFHSAVLGMASSMDVILPQASAPAAAGRAPDHPCLLLLHGLSDDHTIWQRRTSIERYVDPLDVAVVMPNVHRSYYTDMAHGLRYWTFISEEVPALARALFRLSDRREDNFVAGLSMGGYGAFKLALRHPGRFAAAASLSGALDVAARGQGRLEEFPDFRLIFGDGAKVRGSDDDLLACARRLAAGPGPRPRLYQWCGTEDFLYADNLRFRDHARAQGLDLTYREGPGGHEWAAWDAEIQNVLKWLGLRSLPQG